MNSLPGRYKVSGFSKQKLKGEKYSKLGQVERSGLVGFATDHLLCGPSSGFVLPGQGSLVSNTLAGMALLPVGLAGCWLLGVVFYFP